MSTAIAGSGHALYTKHEGTLKDAIAAIHARTFYAKYPEAPSPKVYGETGQADGQARFDAQLGKKYSGLLQGGTVDLLSAEESPYTRKHLEITYPSYPDPETYIRHAEAVRDEWRRVDPSTRAGLLTESLDRVAARFFELALATQHTTGQAWMMSFQASGPHSNDRALETIALGLQEQQRFPANADWVKPAGKDKEGNMRYTTLKKQWRNVPVGISLCIGCSTFPVWNTAPAIYASLVTGNPVIVKPHPKSIYPIALVVEEIQRTLQDHGYSPEIIQLAADTPDAPLALVLAEHPSVKLIDYTGGNSFGDVLEGLKGKRVFTEKAGINSIVLHSTKDVKAMMGNIAFSLSLYSGQMCTCPQNIFIPKSGISTPEGQLSYDDTVAALVAAVKGLVTNEKMGPGILGAIQSPATFDRVKGTEQSEFKVLLPSINVQNPDFPEARIASTTILEVPAERHDALGKEMFGPIAYIVPVADYKQGVALARQLATEHGAITFSSWCVDDEAMEYMTDEMAQSFTSVSFNFVGPIWVNQSAGFSDFHVTGGNPAGNASLSDPEFVLRRFEIVGVRVHP
jgi:phenylacetic acid degradation protein paaN